MSSSPCQRNRGGGKGPCPNPAIYDIDGDLVCGVHAAKRRDPKYLIANKVRTEQSGGLANPEQVSNELRGILLNSAVCEMEFMGIPVKTVEHAYQMMKFYYNHNDSQIKMALVHHVYKISKARDSAEARRLGHEREALLIIGGREVKAALPIRPDWNSRGSFAEEDSTSLQNGTYSMKDCFMFDILERKFRPGTRQAQDLLATGDCDLLDNSNGGDYWSNGTNGHGRNRLGELLTLLRTKLAGN